VKIVVTNVIVVAYVLGREKETDNKICTDSYFAVFTMSSFSSCCGRRTSRW